MAERSPGEALVEQGYAVTKMENEQFSRVAIERPRDEEKILADALKELDRLPQLASRAYYSLPFKDHLDECTARGAEARRKCPCPVNWIRGVGIKGAKNLARRWGNCSATVRFVAQDEESLHMEGVFLDFETAVRFSTPRVISKWKIWQRGGKPEKLSDANLDKLVQIEGSKAKRNAILDGLPDWLVESYYLKARELAIAEERAAAAKAAENANATPGEPIAVKVVQSFALLGVTAEMLVDLLGHPLDTISDDELANLRGIRNAIKEGERSVADIFGGGENDAEPAPSPTGSASERAAARGATVTGGAQKAKPAAAPAHASDGSDDGGPYGRADKAEPAEAAGPEPGSAASYGLEAAAATAEAAAAKPVETTGASAPVSVESKTDETKPGRGLAEAVDGDLGF